MLSRILHVPNHLLWRSWPFFGVYFALFAALTLFDALSLTLFVQRVGAQSLPPYQALSAICVIGFVLGYVSIVDRTRPGTMFLAILLPPIALLFLVWCLVHWSPVGNQAYGALFIGRDIAFALVLLHFGTFLQDYFSREELRIVMPLIYAGGRVGGIVAGAGLQYLTTLIQPLELLPATAAILIAALGGVFWVRRAITSFDETPTERTKAATPITADEQGALKSSFGFLRFVSGNSLMFWITISTVLYFACRTILAFQYNQCFEREFTNEAEMAAFLGAYTKYALAGSLLIQLFFVSRWISFAGLKGAHLTYAGLLLTSAAVSSTHMTLATAVFARLVEGELRYCLRNPVHQMTINLFSKPLRIRARAWSMGFLIPASTFATAAFLTVVVLLGYTSFTGAFTLVAALLYFGATGCLVKHVSHDKSNGSIELTTSIARKKKAFG